MSKLDWCRYILLNKEFNYMYFINVVNYSFKKVLYGGSDELNQRRHIKCRCGDYTEKQNRWWLIKN